MPDFAYVLDLLAAKGWYLYEGVPHSNFPEIISAGRARSLRPNVFYHLMPATVHDTSVEEVQAALAHAGQTDTTPKYRDGVNEGSVHGIYLSDDAFAFASKPDSFTFSVHSQSVIESAIKFNLSNYNVFSFKSIEDIGSFFNQNGLAPQRPSVLPSQLRWTYAHRDEDPNWIAIHPENPGDLLFRGQGKRYIPCVSTAARGLAGDARLVYELSKANQAHLIVNFIKTEWFVELVRDSAAVKWLREKHIFVDEMAVAQHYGLPTGYIDLTQSFEVAAFFACCRYDSTNKSWTAVGDGEGVVYTVQWRTVPPDCFIRPINLQCFPRPSEQWGWTCELRLGEDFDKLPFVQKFIFNHDLEASRRILARFSGGKDLFPDDPLSELADRIISSAVVPADVAEWIATDLIKDPQGKPGATVTEILSLVQECAGVKASSDARIPDLEKINSELDDIWKQKQDSFFRGIGVRLARTRRTSQMESP